MARPRVIDRLLHATGHRHAPAAFLILLPFAFFWRETLGLRVLGDQDAVFWFFPAYQQVVEQVRAGQLPLWNVYVYSGMPLFAAWQAGILDPLNLLYLFIGVSSRTLTLVQQLSFAVSGLGTFAFARSIGLSKRGAIIAAVIFAFGGYPVARTLYPGLLHVTALTPLVLFFVERCFQGAGDPRSWRMSVLGSLVVAWQVFAAHPQPLLYSSLLGLSYAIFRASGRQGFTNLTDRLRFLGQCVVIFAGGACLAAIQILPAFEFAGNSVRQTWPYEMFTLHSLHPVSLVGAVIPFLHGGGRGIYQLPYWGPYWHHNEAQIYLGAIAISFAVAGAVGAWRVRQSVFLFWTVAGIAGLILALGKYSGPVAWALYRVPVISSFRSPNRYWVVVTLAVAVLTGYAVDRLLRPENGGLGRVAIRTAVVLAAIVCGVSTVVILSSGRVESFLQSFAGLGSLPQGFLNKAGAELWVPSVSSAVAAALIIAFTRRNLAGRVYWLLLGLLVVDLNLYAAFAPIGTSKRLEERLGSAMPSVLAKASLEYRSHLLIDPAAGEFSPLLFYGHEMASGYDPLLDARYKHFSGIDEAGRSNLASLLSEHDRTLDLLNVRYVLVAPAILAASAAAGSAEAGYRDQLNNSRRWRRTEVRSPIEEYRDYVVFENLSVLPRAWLATAVRILDDEDQLKVIRGRSAEGTGFSAENVVLIGQKDVSGPQEFSSENRVESVRGRVRIAERRASRITVEVETDETAMLVLSEMFEPGWRARIDGRNEPIRQVDYLLRGVPLEKGRHRVEFSYEPRSLEVGAVLTLVSALALAVMAFRRPRHKS